MTAADTSAADQSTKAQERLAQLECMADEAGRNHAIFRGRLESRLGGLRAAFDQEEQEDGAAVSRSRSLVHIEYVTLG